MSGTLYIVSTPIGNLEDITLRALRVLREVHVIAAEDTRHSLKLLNHHGISKPLISYWGEREKVRSEEIIRRLNGGESVALISDAGTPGISDPGQVVVQRAVEEGISVVPIPGPTAFVAALSASGLPTREFCFAGFLPPKQGQRRKVLEGMKGEKRTTVFYEAPHRVVQTVEDMAEVFGVNRRAVLAREITKIYEEFFRGTLSEISEHLHGAIISGEYVIIIEASPDMPGISMSEAVEQVEALVRQGIRRKDAVKTVAGTHGLRKKELYEMSIQQAAGQEDQE